MISRQIGVFGHQSLSWLMPFQWCAWDHLCSSGRRFGLPALWQAQSICIRHNGCDNSAIFEYVRIVGAAFSGNFELLQIILNTFKREKMIE